MPEDIYGRPTFTPWESALAGRIDNWRKSEVVQRLARREEVPGNVLAAALFSTGLAYDDSVRALHTEVRAIWNQDKRNLEAIETELSAAEAAHELARRGLGCTPEAVATAEERVRFIKERMHKQHNLTLKCEGGV